MVVVESKDKTKSKFERRKDLFIAASKNNIRDISQSSVSSNRKTGNVLI